MVTGSCATPSAAIAITKIDIMNEVVADETRSRKPGDEVFMKTP
jgi:hypothetical protein